MSGPSIFTSIFARNCRVEKIISTRAREFLESSHPFGWSKCRHCYALVLEKATREIPAGSIVAVSCFSNARRWKKADELISSYEWVRYASLPGTRVLGGMGKTLSAFIEDVKPDDIMTYAPVISHNTEPSEDELPGDAYLKLGFIQEGEKIFDSGRSIKFRMRVRKP